MINGDHYRRAKQGMVPGVGLEPTRCRHRWILNPLRLPISPPGPGEMEAYYTDKKPFVNDDFNPLRYNAAILDNSEPTCNAATLILTFRTN